MISVAPPMLRQSTLTGAPYFAACQREKASAYSCRIASFIGVMITSTGSPGFHSRAPVSCRNAKGNAITAARTSKMERFRAII